ncbi:ATP-dependent DNA helicase RecG [Candidatus Electrothrix aarhusensis]|uniref:ATP-dependent DNA helicase RecG n=1 Tax=Candidatus Electrothrix aarhusensis TaxID=1859131 RepID=A0A3S3R4I2_9BACT|nr:ATP-dependent DNA helicase RecG [Candidatus Electrothrix aarhusensis]
MDFEELKDLIQAGESYHAEFKQTLDKSFVEESCAFANSGGGRILLGVSDSGDIKGITTDNIMRSRIQDTLRQIEPKLSCRVDAVLNIFVITIPEGTEKPYGCSKGFFMRMGANSQKLSRNEIIDFYQKEGRIRFDELRHSRADFEQDFDSTAFSRFLDLAGISRTIDQNTLLRNLNCLTADNRLTNAGVLFFSKDIDFILNHAVVVCALYKGDIKVNILDKKEFSGNIVDNIDNALLFVKRHTNVAYKIESTQHEEIPDYPEVALREAIINAVCHRDYFDKRSLAMVEVFENRVEISNPGGLPTGLKPEDFGTKSVARNPLIASLLHRIDYIERMGTGISRIRGAVEQHGGCTVEFAHTAFYTTIFRKNKAEEVGVKASEKKKDDFRDDFIVNEKEKAEKKDLLSSCSSEITSRNESICILQKLVGRRLVERVGSKLVENQLNILILLKQKPKTSKKELAESLKISTTAIDKNITKLKTLNVLKRVGPAKGGYWEIIE